MLEITRMKPVVNFEHTIGHVDSIPVGEGRTFVLGARRIAVFRPRNGRVYATQAECPHRGGPLADGILAGTNIVCPLHEFRFNLERGGPVGNQCEALKIYPIRVDDAGELTVLLDPER